MNTTITLNKFSPVLPFIFLAFWSVILFANFVPAIPQPDAIIGYLWKVEFALAAFLFIALALFLKFPPEKRAEFSKKEFFSIILPIVLFTAWSGFSVFWAEARRDAIHHTLLWACYCVFYFLIRQLVRQPKFLSVSMKFTGFVVGILGAACVVEYLSGSANLNAIFTFRYYKYAEIAVALLPLFLALALKSRNAILFGTVSVSAWLLVLLSLSRTVFISGFVAVVLFFALAPVFCDFKKYLKKSVVLIGLLLISAAVSQINFSTSTENSTVNRFSGGEHSQASFNSRFLFWEIALEAFKKSPIQGVGADNYALVYKTARENLSLKNPENKFLEINEEILAERTHNEFLQILAELGVVGVVLFGWILLGVARVGFSMPRKSASLLTIASLAGIAAFLISSAASSYSLRVPANGICFFFLIALAAKSLKSEVLSLESRDSFDSRLQTPDSKLAFAFGLIICASMLVFSAVRGAGLMYLQFALSASEDAQAETYFQKAIALDGGEASFRYYYGLCLYDLKRADEAAQQLRFGIDKGISTSIAYFNLASAQNVSKKPQDAEKTFAEALRVYPRSVFLRTAYAAFLKENGRDSESGIELEKASNINASQAKSWWIAHTKGIKKLTETESADKTVVKAMDLKPTLAIYALLDFQRQFNPNLVRR